MNCYTHKNQGAVGVCSRCGCGVCQTCAEEGFPTLCPACKIIVSQKRIKRIRQNNRIMLYLGLLFAALLFTVSYIVYLTNEKLLWFLLNIPTLIFIAVFILCLLKNKKKKKLQADIILNSKKLKSSSLQIEPALTASEVKNIVADAVREIVKQVKLPAKTESVTVLKAEPVTYFKTEAESPAPAVKPEPKSAAKEKKNNPFAPESKPAKQSQKSKAVKKVWTCECGYENPTSKLFCMDCGLKRTKEMLQNAKEI